MDVAKALECIWEAKASNLEALEVLNLADNFNAADSGYFDYFMKSRTFVKAAECYPEQSKAYFVSVLGRVYANCNPSAGTFLR
jgi:hypothetical protein